MTLFKRFCAAVSMALLVGLCPDLASVVHAAEAAPVMATNLQRDTDCDQRSGQIRVVVHEPIRRLGYGIPDSDIIVWTRKGGVAAGIYRLNLPKQAFGSKVSWLAVALKRDGSIEVGDRYTFRRPERAACVFKQRLQLSSYDDQVNQRCPKGSDSLFIVGIWVRTGTPGYIVRGGSAQLTKLSGFPFAADGIIDHVSSERLVEYTLVAGRKTRVQLDSDQNTAWPVVTSSPGVQLDSLVFRTCVNNQENT